MSSKSRKRAHNVVDLVDVFDSPPHASSHRKTPRRHVVDVNVAQRYFIDLDSSDDDSVRVRRRNTKRAQTSVRKTPIVDLDDDDRKPAAQEDDFAIVRVVQGEDPVGQVIDVFPDVSRKHVRSLLENGNSVPSIVEQLMADTSYPKEEQQSWKPAAGKIDYMSMDAFETDKLYREQSAQRLAHDFPFLHSNASRNLLQKYNCRYAIIHDKIIAVLKGEKASQGEELIDAQYRRLLRGLAGQMDPTQLMGIVKLTDFKSAVKKRTKKVPLPIIAHARLVQEINFVQKRLQEFMRIGKERVQREQNKKAAVANNTAVTCSCCFDDNARGDMIECSWNGHLFCVDCLQNYAKNQVFGTGNFGINAETRKPNLDLLCFHPDGCKSNFERAMIEKAFPPDLLKKYDAMQCQISIEAAGLNNELSSCPGCGFQAALPETQRIFQCPDCMLESCRDCGEPAHIPLRCDEVEKKAETDSRLTVEEAISAAKIRRCPKCNKPFVKSDGCNKVACACRTLVCYVCRKAIKDYNHFCQVPHCRHDKGCTKCPLYTNDQQDDERAMREAGLQTAAKQKAAVDVNAILADPAAPRRAPVQQQNPVAVAQNRAAAVRAPVQQQQQQQQEQLVPIPAVVVQNRALFAAQNLAQALVDPRAARYPPAQAGHHMVAAAQGVAAQVAARQRGAAVVAHGHGAVAQQRQVTAAAARHQVVATPQGHVATRNIRGRRR